MLSSQVRNKIIIIETLLSRIVHLFCCAAEHNLDLGLNFIYCMTEQITFISLINIIFTIDRTSNAVKELFFRIEYFIPSMVFNSIVMFSRFGMFVNKWISEIYQ